MPLIGGLKPQTLTLTLTPHFTVVFKISRQIGQQNEYSILLICAYAYVGTDAHGTMVSPAARNSAWRFGFDTPANDEDNALRCGGRYVQHIKNGGRCGVCGDPWNVVSPRPHERGGQFGRGIITASYTEGQVIPVTLNIIPNHMGWFEFRLCNNSNQHARDSQECLNEHLLQFVNGTDTRYNLDASIKGLHTMYVQLPADLYCSHCVLQWTWVTGHSWGMCTNGRGKLGCGPQLTFVNCADVRILPKGQVSFDSVNSEYGVSL
ncbi:hypothetical protein SK128_027953 [Halocaridina rubra]|uniref:Chitin-binding type-4 domain-containing protein n=1 Tax=Halocaridina rubra TaxID=373956 RepID=A0AAN9AE61_HALRR